MAVGNLTPPVAVDGAAITDFTVSHFTDANPSAKASDYSALVALGDGTSVTVTSTPTSNGQIVADPAGGFDVQVSHVYATAFSGATFGVQVNGPRGQTTQIGSNAFSVTNAPMTAGNLTPPVATQYKPIQNATIFHFTDGNPLATANQFTAVVVLGDGSQVTLTGTLGRYGQIAANPDGGFDVQLSYTYTEP